MKKFETVAQAVKTIKKAKKVQKRAATLSIAGNILAGTIHPPVEKAKISQFD